MLVGIVPVTLEGEYAQKKCRCSRNTSYHLKNAFLNYPDPGCYMRHSYSDLDIIQQMHTHSSKGKKKE